MATHTGQQQLQVISDITSSDTFQATGTNITAVAAGTAGRVVLTTTNAGALLAGASWVLVEGTTDYDGVHQVLARTTTTITIAGTFGVTRTGTWKLRTAQGFDLVSNAAMIFGSGSSPKTNIVHDTQKSIALSHSVGLYANSDQTAVLAIGTPDNPTALYLAYSGTDWANGGPFLAQGTTLRPRLRLIRCNITYVARIRQSAFGGNTMRLVLDAERCNFSWQFPTAVPFLGTGGIIRDCIFRGATNVHNASADHPLFLALPRVFTGCVVRRWGIGLKCEHGSAFWGQAEWQDCDVEAFISRTATSAGRSAGDMNLVDSLFDKARVFISYRAQVNCFRTVRLVAKQSDGTAVSGVPLYALDTGPTVPVERRYAAVIKASVQVSGGRSYYQGENTTVGNITDARDVMHVFRPGERINVSGFSTAGNNGDKVVRGKDFGGTRYADTRELEIVETGLTAEATPSGNVTITKLPPFTAANGESTDHLVHVFHAQATDYGNNAVAADRSNVESIKRIEDGTTVSTRLETGSFTREEWRLVTIPAYPFARHSMDVSLPMNTGGQRLDWAPAMVNNPLLTVTTAATVAAYTSVTDLDRLYDILEHHKSLSANHAFPRLDLPIATIDGETLDFGALNVTFDGSATALIATSGTTVTIKAESAISGTTRLTRIKTTGTVTLTNSAVLNVPYTDSAGSTGRITLTAGSNDNIALYSPDGSLRVSGVGSMSTNLTAAQCQAGMKAVAMRPGYVPQVRTVSTLGGGAFGVSFDTLKKDKQPDGTDSIGSLSANISIAFTVSDISDVQMRVDIGNAQVRAQAAWTEASTAAITANGLKYLAFGGTIPIAVLSPLGDSFFLPSSAKLRRAASGDSNAGILATVIQANDQPIDTSNGDVQLIGGVTLSDISRALAFDLDIDSGTAGNQSLAATLLATKTDAAAAVARLGTGGGNVTARLAALGTELQSNSNDDASRHTALVNRIGTGGGTLTARLASIATAVAGINTSVDLSSVTDRLGTGGDTITQRLTNLAASIAVVDGNVDDIEGQVGSGGDSLTARMTALAGYVDTLEARLGTGGDDLTTRIASVAAALTARGTDAGTKHAAEVKLLDAILAILGGNMAVTNTPAGRKAVFSKIGTATNLAEAVVTPTGDRQDSRLLT